MDAKPVGGSDRAASGRATVGAAGSDRAVRVTLPEPAAELVGAVLMDRLGPFAQERVDADAADPFRPDATPAVTGAPAASGGPAIGGGAAGAAEPRVILTFYPEIAGLPAATVAEVEALLPPGLRAGVPGGLAAAASDVAAAVETSDVARDWEEGWKEHFHPLVIGRIRIRPPWEAAEVATDLIDVVINPGLGFGTGLHPTTRGTLQLLQDTAPACGSSDAAVAPAAARDGTAAGRGPLVDAGAGSGVLSIAAAKLGWGPIQAFDNDPAALIAAAGNLETNGVSGTVTLHQTDVAGGAPEWFAGATVLANMTLEPVSALLGRLAGFGPAAGGVTRLVVSGILAGEQERQLLALAERCGLVLRRAVYEAEWVSMELSPAASAAGAAGSAPAGAAAAPALTSGLSE